jgi:hypothetical protein
MSSDLRLYHSAASPNSRRVRIFLAEKGSAIPLAPVDLAKGEQHSDAYRAINPLPRRGLRVFRWGLLDMRPTILASRIKREQVARRSVSPPSAVHKRRQSQWRE